MKKLNIEEKVQVLNNFCRESEGRTFTGAQLNEALMDLGFTKTIAGNIAQRCFPYEKIGVSRLYEIPKTPIYIGVLASIYQKKKEKDKKYQKKEIKKEQTSEISSNDTTKAWETLIKAGVIKTRLNINKLKSEYPAVYLKCLDYEIVR